MENIIIVASIKVKVEYLAEVKEALTNLHILTNQNDKGCIQYELHQDLEDEYSFTFIETWENQTLLDEHMKKQHFLDFVSLCDGKLLNMDVKKLRKLEK